MTSPVPRLNRPVSTVSYRSPSTCGGTQFIFIDRARGDVVHCSDNQNAPKCDEGAERLALLGDHGHRVEDVRAGHFVDDRVLFRLGQFGESSDSAGIDGCLNVSQDRLDVLTVGGLGERFRQAGRGNRRRHRAASGVAEDEGLRYCQASHRAVLKPRVNSDCEKGLDNGL
jgi:hypothetical protein